jgi:hypothetical protein
MIWSAHHPVARLDNGNRSLLAQYLGKHAAPRWIEMLH